MPDDALRPGDVWPGPKVGIAYTLTAGGDDIRHEKSSAKNKRLPPLKLLSDDVGSTEAKRLVSRLSEHKPRGGRIYINEAKHFFAPVESDGKWESIYLGGLDGDSWFSPPTEHRI